MSFQENLKKYRLKAGFREAKQFAERLDIPYQKYISYESRGCQPKFDILCKISQALRVPIDVLLGNEINPCEFCEYSRIVFDIENLLRRCENNGR